MNIFRLNLPSLRFASGLSRRARQTALLSLVAGALVGGAAEFEVESMAGLEVIHPKFREWTQPAYGIVAERNPPTLLWPADETAEYPEYEVRLSRDIDFPAGSTRRREGLAGALFIPPEKLEPGAWYWQVRSAGQGWSETYTFHIGPESREWAPPPAEELIRGIPSHRPRVLVNAPRLEAFRAGAQGTGEARQILSAARQVVDLPPPEERFEIFEIRGGDAKETRKLQLDASETVGQGLYDGVRPLCEAYLITGDPRYAETAVRWALAAAEWDPRGVTHLSDFGDSRIMLSMALVYDTLGDFLSPAEERRLLDAAGTRAEQFYQHYRKTRQEAKVLSGHLWQHILHYLFDTAIALHGEDPRADTWLAFTYETFLARAPLLGGGDGGWAEGISYLRMNMEMLVDIPWRIREYTGFDFIRSTPWYEQNIDLLLYGFPAGSASVGFADNTHDLLEPRGDYLAYADALSRLLDNPYASWYRDRILETTPDLKPFYQAYWRSHFIKDESPWESLGDTRLLRWPRLRYLYDLPSPAPRAPGHLPKGRVFRGVGLTALHGRALGEDPEQNLFVAMRSSPFGVYGHMLADHNTFNLIYGGESLFYHTGYKVAMSAPHRRLYYMNTKSHNGILIDGEGQPYHTEAFGWIEQFLESDRLGYAVGNASRAYDSPTEKHDAELKTFRRHLVMLRPDILVIYDELEAVKPVSWTYLLHSYNPIHIHPDGRQLTVENKRGRASVRLFGSVDTRWSVTDEYPVPAKNWRGILDQEGNLIEYPDNAWHFSAESPETPRMRFLAVYALQSLGEEATEAAPAVVPTDRPGVYRVGEWEISAAMDPAQPAMIRVRDQADTLVFASSGADLGPVPGLDAPGSRSDARLALRGPGGWTLQESPREIPPGAEAALRYFKYRNTEDAR